MRLSWDEASALQLLGNEGIGLSLARYRCVFVPKSACALHVRSGKPERRLYENREKSDRDVLFILFFDFQELVRARSGFFMSKAEKEEGSLFLRRKRLQKRISPF